MQIAVVLTDEQVDALDRLVPATYASRAEAVRTAVAALLAEHRVAALDRQYAEGYARTPPDVDDIDSGRLRPGQAPAGRIWADLEW